MTGRRKPMDALQEGKLEQEKPLSGNSDHLKFKFLISPLNQFTQGRLWSKKKTLKVNSRLLEINPQFPLYEGLSMGKTGSYN